MLQRLAVPCSVLQRVFEQNKASYYRITVPSYTEGYRTMALEVKATYEKKILVISEKSPGLAKIKNLDADTTLNTQSSLTHKSKNI